MIIRRISAVVVLIALTAIIVWSQAGGLINATRGTPQPNDGTTGTTLNQTAIINTSGNAITAGTGNTTVPTYIVIGGAGTTGQANLAMNGSLAPCKMDGTASSTGNFFVINSTTTAGDCHAQSAAPSSGVWVIGYLHDSSTTSGSNALVQVNGFVYGGGGGGSTGYPPPRTTFGQYDEFDVATQSSALWGRLQWFCTSSGSAYLNTIAAGPSNTGALSIVGGTPTRSERCYLETDVGTNTFAAMYGNVSTYTWDQQYTFSSDAYGNSTTGVTLYIGLATGFAAGSPVADGIMLRYDATLGTPDTTFHIACYKGSTTPVTNVNTSITPTTSQNYTIDLFSTVAGTVGATLYNSTGSSIYTNSSVCTGANVTTQALGPGWSLLQAGTTTQTILMDRYSFTSTPTR
jgi:hypothetical protein